MTRYKLNNVLSQFLLHLLIYFTCYHLQGSHLTNPVTWRSSQMLYNNYRVHYLNSSTGSTCLCVSHCFWRQAVVCYDWSNLWLPCQPDNTYLPGQVQTMVILQCLFHPFLFYSEKVTVSLKMFTKLHKSITYFNLSFFNTEDLLVIYFDNFIDVRFDVILSFNFI